MLPKSQPTDEEDGAYVKCKFKIPAPRINNFNWVGLKYTLNMNMYVHINWLVKKFLVTTYKYMIQYIQLV